MCEGYVRICTETVPRGFVAMLPSVRGTFLSKSTSTRPFSISLFYFTPICFSACGMVVSGATDLKSL
jgi:hypothetical protein